MRTDFDYLKIQVIVKEKPGIDGLLAFQDIAITHEAIEAEGLALVAQKITESIIAVVEKKLKEKNRPKIKTESHCPHCGASGEFVYRALSQNRHTGVETWGCARCGHIEYI